MAIDSKAERWSVLHLGRAGWAALPGSGIEAADRAMMSGLYYTPDTAVLFDIELTASVVFGLALANTPTFGLALASTTVFGLALAAEPQE